MDEHTPATHRMSATVRDRDVAEQIVVDLSEQGIARDRVHTRRIDATDAASSPRVTGEQDIGFTESVGKTMGVGWLVGVVSGAIIGAIGVTVLFAPPWESGLAAGITLAVAIGVGYLSGGMGLLQAGIARGGERGGEPMTRRDPGHAESDRGLPADGAQGAAMEVVVDAATEDEARAARAIFQAHDVRPSK